jgi:hypothetical protein
MSSVPTPSKVTDLRYDAKLYRQLQREIGDLETKINSAQGRLTQAKIELRQAQEAIIKNLEGMDCAAQGNAGWRERICNMLAEFENQHD